MKFEYYRLDLKSGEEKLRFTERENVTEFLAVLNKWNCGSKELKDALGYVPAVYYSKEYKTLAEKHKDVPKGQRPLAQPLFRSSIVDLKDEHTL